MRRRWIEILLFIALVLGFSWRPSLAQSGDPQPVERRYFPQTGHWVMGDFLQKYESVPEPEKVFGYPITEAYQEQFWGRVVQYFEYARFELQPDAPEELRVHLTELGNLMWYKNAAPLPLATNLNACRSFTESEKVVCYAFRDFYEAYGGPAVFGYPLTNFVIVDQRIVQYFDRARFEWHPERLPGEGVVLTPLGRQYFDQLKEDPARLKNFSSSGAGSEAPQMILSLQARAFVSAAVLPRQAEQTVYIIVQDQNQNAISNAAVDLVIRLPGGEVQRFIVPTRTDAHGIARFGFLYDSQKVGEAVIDVAVSLESFTARTVTSFRIWH